MAGAQKLRFRRSPKEDDDEVEGEASEAECTPQQPPLPSSPSFCARHCWKVALTLLNVGVVLFLIHSSQMAKPTPSSQSTPLENSLNGHPQDGLTHALQKILQEVNGLKAGQLHLKKTVTGLSSKAGGGSSPTYGNKRQVNNGQPGDDGGKPGEYVAQGNSGQPGEYDTQGNSGQPGDDGGKPEDYDTQGNSGGDYTQQETKYAWHKFASHATTQEKTAKNDRSSESVQKILNSDKYLKATSCPNDRSQKFSELLDSQIECSSKTVRFDDCMTGTGNWEKFYRTRCRNYTCLVEKHMSLFGGRCAPKRCNNTNSYRTFGALENQVSDPDHPTSDVENGDPQPANILSLADGSAIEEFHCNGTNDRDAIKRFMWGITRSDPVVFRGCATKMPAIKKWTHEFVKANLRGKMMKNMFHPHFAEERTTEGGLGPCPDHMVEDLYPTEGESHFMDFLKRFRGKNWIWVSQGGRSAQSHFDTFDNVHVVINEKKKFYLGSPKYAPSLYLDFNENDCPGKAMNKRLDIGCDALGCYNFLPFNDGNLDFQTYPKLKEVKLKSALLEAGDGIFIPQYWFHASEHYPKHERGRNMAVAFLRQRQVCVGSLIF